MTQPKINSREQVLRLHEVDDGQRLLRGERWARARGHARVCGVDEVGRGPLAGPVVAAAAVLSPALERQMLEAGLDDSKKLGVKRRERLATLLRKEAAFGLAEVDVETIDRINILRASQLAMTQAIAALERAHPALLGAGEGDRQKVCLLVDGHLCLEPSPLPGATQRALVKGDGHSLAIAAASVIAKVHRDALMVALDAVHPGYDLAANKGYPTVAHRAALRRLGPTPVHRRSFRGVLP